MKSLAIILFCVFSSFTTISNLDITTEKDTSVLIGEWKLDMTPQDDTDDNFAMMRIEKIKDYSFKGVFYREGVKIREGQLNTQSDFIYGALISGDNSGEYNSTFYYKDGMLYGSTHAIGRGFLSVWTATKVD